MPDPRPIRAHLSTRRRWWFWLAFWPMWAVCTGLSLFAPRAASRLASEVVGRAIVVEVTYD